MTQPTKTVAAFLGAITVVLLTACSTTPFEPITTIVAQPLANDKTVATEISVGSRIPRKSTDRLVHRTDAAGAKDMERARPPESGPAFN